ncbi:ABC transporter permease [Fundicoccus culcitae]|uniref:ABC transporter permease subunit n=1 Tax=Fundicoccus culcitae TaxID=2969821 RepID=A0ABY5P408_9LACT|nr:ABC transporter permease subunit [Fundicoccus culcitae]UUX33473.1 ABC transporter permease subunit [Fundicoccus culcitae]
MKENKWTPYLLVAPSFIIVITFVVVPMFNSIFRSFADPEDGSFTLDNYLFFFTDPVQQQNIIYTLQIVLITVVLTLVISYLLAIYLRFSKSRVSKWMGWLVLLPRFIPGLVAVYSMILMIRDAGVLARIANWFGIELSLGWMYNMEGIVIMNLWFNIPFSSLILLSALSNVKDSYIEGLRDVGGNTWHVFTKLLLPITYKDMLMSMTFVFMGNIGSFTTPFLMGANHPKMLGVVLYDQFNSYMAYERAAALSVIMFIFCSFAAVLYIVSNLRDEAWEKQ